MNIRLLKGFFIVITGLFVFITILSLFMPSKLMVTRAVVINAGAGKVYDEISNLQNWKHWQPVFQSDSSNIIYFKNQNGISDSCAWESGGKSNTLYITRKQFPVVAFNLKRHGEQMVQNTISVLPLADSTRVQVEWNVLIRLKWYPWEKFYGLFIEKITGQGYETALEGLKSYTEQH